MDAPADARHPDELIERASTDRSRVGGLIRWFDAQQQRRAGTAVPVAVLKKYADDRGNQLASLITFAAFLSFFPLVLVIVTITSFVAHLFPSVASDLRTSALAQFPVVGPQLTSGERALPGSGLGLGVGLVGLAWGGLRVTHALQYAFHEIWHVPFKHRPSFARRILRGIGLFLTLAVGAVASAALAALGSIVKGSIVAGALGIGGAFAVSFGLYLVTFWLLSPRTIRLRDLTFGAVLATVGWQALQQLGIRLIANQLRRSSELYGAVGAALGLIWFLYVSTQLLLIALEISSVRTERLWPRSLVEAALRPADAAVLSGKAKQEERRRDQHVEVRFDSA